MTTLDEAIAIAAQELKDEAPELIDAPKNKGFIWPGGGFSTPEDGSQGPYRFCVHSDAECELPSYQTDDGGLTWYCAVLPTWYETDDPEASVPSIPVGGTDRLRVKTVNSTADVINTDTIRYHYWEGRRSLAANGYTTKSAIIDGNNYAIDVIPKNTNGKQIQYTKGVVGNITTRIPVKQCSHYIIY